MKRIQYYIMLLLLAVVFTNNSTAQTKVCQFGSKDYQSLGIFDQWNDSPFNNGKLEGNVSVVDNIIKSEVNESEKVLALQRSRYGSHIFGAKVRIKEPFELTSTIKYVHAMVFTPNKGRMMLVGLGKRTDRPGQSDQVVQFHATSISNIKVNEWCDAVFAIKGNGGILISSLVLVPHCESPHNLTQDFMAYFDDIEISDKITPRYSTEDYFINFSKELKLKRNDRHADKVSLTGNNGANLSVDVPTTTNKLVYQDLTSNVGFARAGETLTPKINYSGTWMHGYTYVDYNNDGKIDYGVNADGTPKADSELVAYSYFKGKNSVGESPSNANPGVNPPTFTLPTDLANGIYRVRYKVDWDNIDPAGSIESGNHIQNNAGTIVDVLLNVHGDKSHVKIFTRNGDILKSDGSIFEESDVEFGKEIEIELKPESGFQQNGVIVKHGYLANDEFLHSNRQWRIDTIPASYFINNKYTIPAQYIDGNLEITAEFAEKTGVENVEIRKGTFEIQVEKEKLVVIPKREVNLQIADISGKIFFSDTIINKQTFTLKSGIYLVNHEKVLVK